MVRLRCWYMVTPAPSTVNAAWKGAFSFVIHILFFFSFALFFHVALQGL